jgi:hypothetical protein
MLQVPPYLFAGRYLSIFSALFTSSGNIHLLSLLKIQPFTVFVSPPSIYDGSFLQILWPRLTSHNKSFSTVLHTSFPHVCEISRGKTNNLHSMYPHHLHSDFPCSFWTLFCNANSSNRICLIMFVFLGAELCLQIPSDSQSPTTHLLLANGWKLQSPITDLHRLVIRHARRTLKRPEFIKNSGLFCSLTATRTRI